MPKEIEEKLKKEALKKGFKKIVRSIILMFGERL